MRCVRYSTLLATAAFFLLGNCLISTSAAKDKGDKLAVYFGTYTRGDSKGIYRSTLDLSSGRLSEPALVAETENPSFLAVHPSRRFLYAVNETGNFQGQKSGAVSAFAIDAKTGGLTFLNQRASRGDPTP